MESINKGSHRKRRTIPRNCLCSICRLVDFVLANWSSTCYFYWTRFKFPHRILCWRGILPGILRSSVVYLILRNRFFLKFSVTILLIISCVFGIRKAPQREDFCILSRLYHCSMSTPTTTFIYAKDHVSHGQIYTITC